MFRDNTEVIQSAKLADDKLHIINFPVTDSVNKLHASSTWYKASLLVFFLHLTKYIHTYIYTETDIQIYTHVKTTKTEASTYGLQLINNTFLVCPSFSVATWTKSTYWNTFPVKNILLLNYIFLTYKVWVLPQQVSIIFGFNCTQEDFGVLVCNIS